MVIHRFDVYLITLDPTQGSEIKKTRPCVVVSPDELHQNLKTLIIAPMTTTRRAFPTRVETVFDGKTGDIALDQLRSVDHTRLIKKLGQINPNTAKIILTTLQKMFS